MNDLGTPFKVTGGKMWFPEGNAVSHAVAWAPTYFSLPNVGMYANLGRITIRFLVRPGSGLCFRRLNLSQRKTGATSPQE